MMTESSIRAFDPDGPDQRIRRFLDVHASCKSGIKYVHTLRYSIYRILVIYYPEFDDMDSESRAVMLKRIMSDAETVVVPTKISVETFSKCVPYVEASILHDVPLDSLIDRPESKLAEDIENAKEFVAQFMSNVPGLYRAKIKYALDCGIDADKQIAMDERRKTKGRKRKRTGPDPVW